MVVLETIKTQKIDTQSPAYTQGYGTDFITNHHNTNETLTSKLSIPQNSPLDH